MTVAAAWLSLLLAAACTKDADRSILESSRNDSISGPLTLSSAVVTAEDDPGIVLPTAAHLTITLRERNASWYHALYVASGSEEQLLVGPGYLFPGPSFDVGPYGPGSVVLSLIAYDPLPPHAQRGVAASRVAGSYPSWVVYFEDGFDGDFNDIVVGVEATPVAELVVECTPEVLRGDIVTCTASAQPESATLEVLKWEFTGGGYERSQTSNVTPMWRGKAVVSGTVTVTANVDGKELTAHTSYAVVARDFSGVRAKFDVAEEPSDDLPERPRNDPDLGHVHLEPQGELIRSTVAFDFVGPNSQIAYLTGIPIEYRGRIHINRIALSRGSAFWRAQLVSTPAFDTSVKCTRNQVEGFIPYALAHEGLDRNPRSHAGAYGSKLDELAGPAIEAVTGNDFEEIFTRALAALKPVHDAADRASGEIDNKYPVRYVCDFNFTYPGNR